MPYGVSYNLSFRRRTSPEQTVESISWNLSINLYYKHWRLSSYLLCRRKSPPPAGAKTNNRLRDGARREREKGGGTWGRNATTATTVNITKENAASVCAVRSWAKSGQDGIRFFADALRGRRSPNHSLRISTFRHFASPESRKAPRISPHCWICLYPNQSSASEMTLWRPCARSVR